MTDHARHAPISQPTAERTADQSTQSASGLSAERPGVRRERQDEDDRDRTDNEKMPPDRHE